MRNSTVYVNESFSQCGEPPLVDDLALFFPGSCFSWFSDKILFPFLLYKFLAWKNWSCLSDKIRVDRILAGEARSSSPDKILVFLLSCLILAFLEFLSDSYFSWCSCLILFFLDSCLFLISCVSCLILVTLKKPFVGYYYSLFHIILL